MKSIWKQTKIKAFTISELLVVLVVSTIVISMTFLVLNMVRKQLRLIQGNYQKKQEVQFFENTLTRDFNRGVAYYEPKLNRLLLKNSKDSVEYLFLKQYILREKDTFQIELDNLKLFLGGKEVSENTIDAIEITTSSNFANQYIFVYQTKDVAYSINN